MKVENPHANPSVAIGQAVNEPAARPAGKPASPPAAGGDQVRLSGDLLLAQKAVEASRPPGDVRADLVAKARALLDRGALGNDLEKLADRILDDLTDSHDHDPS